MAIIQGEFTYGGLPRNDVTVKLWPAGEFTSAPAQDTALPSGDPVDDTTTGTDHGGAGAYRFSGVADGSYYVSFEYAGSIVYEYQLAGAANVMDFGAVGDGVADDSAELQAAINAVSGGGRVYLPPGNYKIATGLTIPSGNIRIEGASRIGTKITFSGSSGTALASSDQAEARTALCIENLSFVGSGGTAIGVDLEGFSNVTMTDVEINGFLTQMNLDGTVSNFWNTFVNCKFWAGSPSSGQDGVNFGQSANRQTFVGCQWARLDRQCVIGDGVAAPGPNDIHFVSCSFDLADTCCIDVVRGSGIHIDGGRFEANTLCLQVAGTNISRDIVFAPDHLSSNDAVLAGGHFGLTIRGGGTSTPAHITTGYSTSPAPNRAPNGLMEGWASASDLLGWASLTTTNWATTGNETREGTIKASGTYAAKIGDGVNSSRGIATAVAIPVNADMPYTFTLKYTAPDTDKGLRYGFRCLDAASAVITTGTVQLLGLSTDEIGTAGTGSLTYSAGFNAHVAGVDLLTEVADTYQREGDIMKFPSGTVSVLIGIWTVGAGANRYAYVDEVFLGEGAGCYAGHAKAIGDSGDQSLHGKLLAGNGIGVGNSAAASSLGTVTDKIEVFDAAGASLGFLPVYDAIT